MGRVGLIGGGGINMLNINSRLICVITADLKYDKLPVMRNFGKLRKQC